MKWSLKMIRVGFITLGCKVNIYESNAIKNELIKKGYEIVPISELIYKENYEMDTQGRQHPIPTTKNTTTPKS